MWKKSWMYIYTCVLIFHHGWIWSHYKGHFWDVCDRVVRVVRDTNHMSLTDVCSYPARDIGIFDVRKLKAYKTSSVVLLMCKLVPEIMHGGIPEVFLHQWKVKSRRITLTVSVRLKTSWLHGRNFNTHSLCEITLVLHHLMMFCYS